MNFSHSVITGGNFVRHNTNPSVNGFERLFNMAAPCAFHNSAERFDPPKCHENTRVAVLKKIMDWILRQDPDTRDAIVMWLYGAAGAGKSAIAQSLAEMCYGSNKLLASFFFSRNHPLRGNARALVATLAYQLVVNLPPGTQVREHIAATIEHNPLIFAQSLEEQFLSLIVSPLKQLAESGFFANPDSPRLIIIDGLDECDKSPVQCNIIRTIFQLIHSQRLPILFLIASRPETEICLAFDAPSSIPILARLALDDEYGSFDDIRRFLYDKFTEIKQTHQIKNHIPRSWPTQDVVEALVRKSSGQFIYASTVIKFVGSSRHRPTDRLDIILGIRPGNGSAPFAELDALYTNILSRVDDVVNVLHILSLLILKPSNFWPDDNLEAFLSLKPGDISLILSDLGSLLSLEHLAGFPEPTILHASLKDFLLDSSRSKDFHVNPVERHNEYALLSFQHLKSELLQTLFT
ncbi:hypothetical protein GALMADRAFT_136388 [Galerina marginata CBS 339.88]|uniref:Nephrocystin 3-like N-terminal domain-containing protein n=1 Tax=Galerina marginata (strain CBS 339.88) TaxID=685588 RepID=A0A067TBQ2_GALM3|nr:hypothetical protein GALMADRAFT_136388 [Galerina marginata CBS 339.88]